jgi:hypothetical protein
MNERIKELIWETDEWLESNAQSDRWEREIKFAELIVRECMLQCDINQAGNTRLGKDFNEGHFMGVYESFHKIRNHFGVKEE